MKLKLLFRVVLCFVSLGVLLVMADSFFCASRRDAVADFSARPCSDQENALDFARRKGWLRLSVDPYRCEVADVDSRRIKLLFDQMAVAYEKGEANEIRESYAKIPACVTNLTMETYVKLSGEFNRIVSDRFLHLEHMINFDDLAAFKRYVDCSLLSVEEMAELDLLRQDYAIVRRIDAQVVNVLAKYKSGFEAQNRLALSHYAGHCLESWCKKIDSPVGYTRQYMIFDVSLQLAGDPNLTWRRLVQSVRHHADALVRAGYTPKWLDEDFPLPLMTAEEKTRAMYMKKIAFPPSCVPSPAQSNELLRSVQEVLKVYSERRSKDLMVEIARMPMLITNVTEDVFWDVSLPLWDALFANCYAPKPQNLKEFSSLDEFEEYMEANVVLATYLGNIDSLNFPWDARLLRIDEWMVRMLSQYKDKFAAERKKKFLSSAARYEQRWLTLVESDKGFARTYVRFRLFKAHADTVQERARMARYYVRTLMDLGYTPKWLDEEFPMPQSDSATKDENLPE